MPASAGSAAQSAAEPLRAGGHPPATVGGTAEATLFGRILRGNCGLSKSLGMAIVFVDLVDWVDEMDFVDGMDIADKGGSVEIGLHG